MNINIYTHPEDSTHKSLPPKQVADVQKKLAEIPTEKEKKRQAPRSILASSDKIPIQAGKVHHQAKAQEKIPSTSSVNLSQREVEDKTHPAKSESQIKKSKVPEDIEEYLNAFKEPLEDLLKQDIITTKNLIWALKGDLDRKYMKKVINNIGFQFPVKIELKNEAFIKKFLYGILYVSGLDNFIQLIQKYGIPAKDANSIKDRIQNIPDAIFNQLSEIIEDIDILESLNQNDVDDLVQELLSSTVDDMLETLGLIIESKQTAYEQERVESPEMSTLRHDMRKKMQSPDTKPDASHPFLVEINKEYQAQKANVEREQAPPNPSPSASKKHVVMDSLVKQRIEGQEGIKVTDHPANYREFTKSTKDQRAKITVKKMGEYLSGEIQKMTKRLDDKGEPLTPKVIETIQEDLKHNIDDYLKKLNMDDPAHRKGYLQELQRQIEKLENKLPEPHTPEE